MSGVPAEQRRAEARRAVAALTVGSAGAEGGADTDLVPLLTGLAATAVGGVPRPR